MSGAITNPIEIISGSAHSFEDGMQDVDVASLAIGSDEVGFSDATARQNSPHSGAVILGMNPVAHVKTVAVKFGANTA